MIHYQLRCVDGHAFEGWFRDSAAFDEQAQRGLLSCPQCGAGKVERALMAPSVRTGRAREPDPARQEASNPAISRPGPDAVAAVLPDQVRAALQRLRSEIERTCDDVGSDFADAARRMRDRKASPQQPVRGIYGQVSEPEREALADEGIETLRIPWLPRAES